MYFFFYNNCFATTCACNTVLIFYSFHAILSQIIFITVHKISVHKAIWHNKKHLQVWKICGREIIDNSDLLVDEYVMVIFFITTFFILAWLFVVCSFRNLGKMHRGTNIADFQVTLRMLHRQPFFFFLPKWQYIFFSVCRNGYTCFRWFMCNSKTSQFWNSLCTNLNNLNWNLFTFSNSSLQYDG